MDLFGRVIIKDLMDEFLLMDKVFLVWLVMLSFYISVYVEFGDVWVEVILNSVLVMVGEYVDLRFERCSEVLVVLVFVL